MRSEPAKECSATGQVCFSSQHNNALLFLHLPSPDGAQAMPSQYAQLLPSIKDIPSPICLTQETLKALFASRRH